MKTKVKYDPAHEVAVAIEEYFTELHATKGDALNTVFSPSSVDIERMLDIVFWASLLKEEGYSYSISLAFIPPGQTGQPLQFQESLPFSAKVLTKLAPAVERPGIHLGVWQEEGEFYVWGATRELPGLCFVLEVSEPGKLVVKHPGSDGIGKYINVAVLAGDEVKFIDQDMVTLQECESICTTMQRFFPSANDQDNLLLRLAISMRAHGAGGIVLMVPSGNDKWRESIADPMLYCIVPPFSKLSNLANLSREGRDEKKWDIEFKLVIDGIAGLTAVDGALVINDRYEVYAFGAKIIQSGGKNIGELTITEPVKGNKPEKIHPMENGGMRHLSAAQFVYDQRDAIALVASTDGKFTIFAWSDREQMVHAHRIDVLLL